MSKEHTRHDVSCWHHSTSEAEAEGSQVLGQAELYWETGFRNKLMNQNWILAHSSSSKYIGWDLWVFFLSAINCEQNVSQTVLECTHDTKMFIAHNFKMSYLRPTYHSLIHYCLFIVLIFVKVPEFWYVNVIYESV